MTVISNVVEPGATPPASLSASTEVIERARAIAPGLVAWLHQTETTMSPRLSVQLRIGAAQ